MRHLGQYFTVHAYESTRLYTCVLSMRRENIEFRENILLKLVDKKDRLLRLAKTKKPLKEPGKQGMTKM